MAEKMKRIDGKEASRKIARANVKTESIQKVKAVVLSAEEAKDLVDRIGPSLGCDYTSGPVFPKTRNDVAAVRRTAEDGSDYGYDTIYLVWKTKSGAIKSKELMDSSSSKDYVHVKDVTETKSTINVKVASGGSFSGQAWDDTISVSKKEIGLK